MRAGVELRSSSHITGHPAIPKEQEAGSPTAEVCRRHGISQPTFYAWKAKFGGMETSDAKRLKAVEDENRKLKKRLAEQVMDSATLKELLAKKSF